MNKTQAKKLIKDYGLYTALYELASMRYNEASDLLEIIERVIDNIDTKTLQKAINKATR